jgi:hypothetical protein
LWWQTPKDCQKEYEGEGIQQANQEGDGSNSQQKGIMQHTITS